MSKRFVAAVLMIATFVGILSTMWLPWTPGTPLFQQPVPELRFGILALSLSAFIVAMVLAWQVGKAAEESWKQYKQIVRSHLKYLEESLPPGPQREWVLGVVRAELRPQPSDITLPVMAGGMAIGGGLTAS